MCLKFQLDNVREMPQMVSRGRDSRHYTALCTRELVTCYAVELRTVEPSKQARCFSCFPPECLLPLLCVLQLTQHASA